MKKPFNLRLPVLMAAALASGIIFSAVLAYFGLSGIYILIPAAISFAACVPVAIFYKSTSKPLIFIFAVIFFVAGALYAYCAYMAHCSTDAPLGELVRITARVEEVGTTSGGSRYLILNRASVYGTPLKGKIIAYLGDNAGDYCGRGYTVTFSAVLGKQDFFSGGTIAYRATENVKYYCSVTGGLQSKYHFSLFGEINAAIQSALFDNLDGETAAVCYAMLTGNTAAVSDGTLQAFRNGGIAHVFAVSGLHIGVIYGALSFIFAKARVNRFVSAAVKIAIITLYAGVCNFSPSSVRALVMCSILGISPCIYRKYDGWNALSLSAILLLLINPFYMFDTGFLLSYSAATGIILISPNLKRLLRFLPEKLRGGLAVSLSAQFATVPALMTTFGNVSAAGLFLNIIFVPVISALYVILFVCTLLATFIPLFASSVLPTAVVPLQLAVNLIAECGFENALISTGAGNWLFVPFIAVAVALSDKFNFGHRLFPRGAVITSAVLSVMLVFAARSGSAVTSVTFDSGYSGGSVLINTPSGAVLIVTDNYRSVQDVPVGVHTLVVLGDEDNLSVSFALGGGFNRVYVRGSALPVTDIGPVSVTYADNFEACGVAFSFEGSTLIAQTDGVTISVALEEDGALYGSLLDQADFNLYCYGSDGAVLYTGNQSFGLSVCGAMRYEIANGKIRPSYVIPKE
ncbi:MAG: ComEC/Rec2 family competence protein [Clostridia bacterium]|nr:ComEC/Rec2 family competence protein [Clostridia bacterium]